MSRNLSLKEKAYHCIKQNIITCKWFPGSDLSEDEIATQLGSSRTPIREALLRLEQENLVNIYPRKGSFVSYITIQDIHEIFQIREMIETQAAKITYPHLSKEKMLEFKNSFKEIGCNGELIDERAFYDLDIEFHKFIVSNTNNKYLIEFMNKIYDQDYRIRVMATRLLEQERKRNKPEHIDIIEAILNQDESALEKSIKTHIRNAKKAALKIAY